MIFLNREVQEYLENRFEKIRLLKQSAKGMIWLAADSTGLLVVWKTIWYTGLPYRWLKENHYDLWPKIIYLVEDETETTVIEEYVSGHSLQEVLEQKEYLAEKDVCRIAVQLCQGLAVLHRAGIIHRDIKPANLIWGNGIVRLLDFDAARVQKEEAKEDTVHLGTKGYAPPEQFGYGQTDARSDIYALGVTLLELLGPDYHGYLRPILKKCKEIDPKKRYQKVQSVQAAIRYHWRRRLLGGAALIVCVISLLLAGDYWWQVRQGNDVHQRHVLEQDHGLRQQYRQHVAERLRQDHVAHHLPVGKAQRVAGAALSARDALDAGAHDLAVVARLEKDEGDERRGERAHPDRLVRAERSAHPRAAHQERQAHPQRGRRHAGRGAQGARAAWRAGHRAIVLESQEDRG